MNPEIEAVILAGGQGKRMNKLVENHQKCMLLVEDRPILAHILDNIQLAFGTAKVIMSIGYKGNEVRDYFGSQYGQIKLDYVTDSGLIENRRALLRAKNQLHGPFLATSGDVIVSPTQYLVMAEKLGGNKGALGVISVATDHTPAPTHAVIYANNDILTKVYLYPTLPTASSNNFRDMTLHFYDYQMLTIFEAASNEERLISSVIYKQVEIGKTLLAARYTLQWYHFAHPEDLNTAIIFTH